MRHVKEEQRWVRTCTRDLTKIKVIIYRSAMGQNSMDRIGLSAACALEMVCTTPDFKDEGDSAACCEVGTIL